MARSYKHIKGYENEILEMRREGKTRKEIGDALGFSKEQIKDFLYRYNQKQKRLAAGIEPRPKGRPRKNGFKVPPSIERLGKLAQLQYELASKDRRIKSLEMENELMRDFLSLTERK